MMVLYFAYGSNMNPERMRERGVKFKSFRPAKLKGYRLAFNKACYTFPGYGCANVEPDPNGVVEGVLYEVLEGLESLDSYEGYPRHYGRREVEVETPSGEKVKAVCYVAQPAFIKEGLKPHPNYLKHLLKACQLGLLSKSYCKKIESLFREKP